MVLQWFHHGLEKLANMIGNASNELTFTGGLILSSVNYSQNFTIYQHYADFVFHAIIGGCIPLALKWVIEKLNKLFTTTKPNNNEHNK